MSLQSLSTSHLSSPMRVSLPFSLIFARVMFSKSHVISADISFFFLVSAPIRKLHYADGMAPKFSLIIRNPNYSLQEKNVTAIFPSPKIISIHELKGNK